MLFAARLDRITRRTHTLTGLLEEELFIRPTAMPGADDQMMRVYAAMAQKERRLISERTRAVLGWGQGGALTPPCAASAAICRFGQATRTADRVVLELEALQVKGSTTHQGMARAPAKRGMATPRGGVTWTRTTVARVFERLRA